MWYGSSDVEASSAVSADMAAVISTRMLPENRVSTTILSTLAAVTPHEADVFSEDDIEKAIAEIRGAIERSSQVLK